MRICKESGFQKLNFELEGRRVHGDPFWSLKICMIINNFEHHSLLLPAKSLTTIPNQPFVLHLKDILLHLIFIQNPTP